MKNFISTAIFAILSMSAVAASAQDVLTESVTDGNTVQSRSLASNGMLTESICQTATTTADGAVMQKCKTRQTKLSSKESRALYSQMVASYSDSRQQAQDFETVARRTSISQLESGTGLSKATSADALSKFQPSSKSSQLTIGEMANTSSQTSQSASKKFARISATYCGNTSVSECASQTKTGTTNVANQSIALRN